MICFEACKLLSFSELKIRSSDNLFIQDHLEKVCQLRGFTSAIFIYFAIVVADSCFKMPLWVTAIVKVMITVDT